MNLRYINLWIDTTSGYDEDYRYEFKLHTRFINHFLSIQIRKLKLETDGTYNMIFVAPMPNNIEECKIIPLDVLKVTVPFDKNKYEQIKKTKNHEYYLELMEEGFKKASKIKNIPLDSLINLLNDFRKNIYKNEWLFKKKKFKKQDIEVILDCKFTSFDFQLVISVNKISTKEKLVTGTIIRTLPDEIYFDKMFKDILVDNDYLIITDASDSTRVQIDLKEILNKKFNFKLVGDNEVNKLLSYDGGIF